MAKLEHSPGPFSVRATIEPTRSRAYGIADAAGMLIANVPITASSRAQLDATLLAASWTMLDVLEDAIKHFGRMLEDTPADRVMATRMRDAIKMARGTP